MVMRKAFNDFILFNVIDSETDAGFDITKKISDQ